MQHVAVVTKRLPPKHVGGMEDHALLLVCGLERRGFRITVFAGAESAEARGWLRASTSFVVVPEAAWDRHAGGLVQAFRSIDRDARVDIVVAESGAGLPLLRSGVGREMPVVSIFHGNPWNETISVMRVIRSAVRRRYIRREALRSTKAVLTLWGRFLVKERGFYQRGFGIVVTPSDLRRTRAVVGIPRDRLGLVWNGVAAGRAEDTTPVVKNSVLFAGRVSIEKGLFILFEAVAWLKVHGRVVPNVTVAGDGPAMEDMKALAIRLGISGHVTWLGAVEGQGMPRLYRQHERLVVPSLREESMPLVVLSGLAHGKRVIATRVGGVLALVPHSNLRLIRPGDTMALVRALDERPSGVLCVGASPTVFTFTVDRMVDETVGMLAFFERMFVNTAEGWT
jgi:glycosyltransferase involved in cell wall biosynthesis